MILRRAIAEDLPQVQRIVLDSYGHYVARIGRAPAPMLADYPALIESGVVTLAERDGVTAGLLVLLEQPDHLLIDNVAVDPPLQGRGVGRVLLTHAESEARRRGFGEIRLYTNAKMTENIALYGRIGYRETGRAGQDGYARVFFAKSLA